MRIAVWHNLPSGGGKRALHYHVRGLVERGHTVEAWRPPTADQTYLPLSDLIREHVKPLAWPSPPKNIAARFLGAYPYMARRIRAMDRHCMACAEEIKQGGFDLLYINACQFFRVTAIGRYLDMPKALYLQEPYRPLYEAMPALLWLALPQPRRAREWPLYALRFVYDVMKVQGYRLQAREEWRNAQVAGDILVNSLFSRESVLRAYGLQAKVCSLGIDTELFSPGEQSKEHMVVGVGAFVYEKNIGFIIRALARVPEPRPRLVWIGNVAIPRYLEELKALAQRLGVQFEPETRVSDSRLLDTLGRAKMMLYAPRLEPFGFAPLEANACGLPVVAVAEGGVRETVADGVNGLLVEPEPEAMAAAIVRLLNNEAYAKELGERGRRIVIENWSLPAAIDRLEARLADVTSDE